MTLPIALAAILGAALGYLGARLSPRWLSESIHPWEPWALAAASGLVTGLLAFAHPLSPYFWHHLLFMAILTVAAFADLHDRIIPNELIIAGLGVWLLVMLFAPYPEKSWLQALGGGAAGFAFFYLLAVLVPGGMGMGDVKLALVMGLFLGLNWIGMALILAFLVGGIVSAVLLLARRIGRKGHIPFGPFLALGAIVTAIWGWPIWVWYIGG